MSFEYEDQVAHSNNMCNWGKSHDSLDPLPFAVMEYVSWYGSRLDGQQFSAMCLAGDVQEILDDLTGLMRDTSVCLWTAKGRQWRGCSVTDFLCHSSQLESQYAGCFEAVRYESRSNDIHQQLGGRPFSDWPTDPGKVVCFSFPYYQIYFFPNCHYWSCDADLEFRMSAHEREIMVVYEMGNYLPYSRGKQRVFSPVVHSVGNELNFAAFLLLPPLLFWRIIRAWSAIVVRGLMWYGTVLPANLLRWCQDNFYFKINKGHWLLMLWPGGGPRGVWVAHFTCCSCASSRGSLRLLVFCPCLRLLIGHHLRWASTLSGNLLVFRRYGSLLLFLSFCDGLYTPWSKLLVRGESETRERR